MQKVIDKIIPAIQVVKEDDCENTRFRQDGPAPNFAVNVKGFMNETFF